MQTIDHSEIIKETYYMKCISSAETSVIHHVIEREQQESIYDMWMETPKNKV